MNIPLFCFLLSLAELLALIFIAVVVYLNWRQNLKHNENLTKFLGDVIGARIDERTLENLRSLINRGDLQKAIKKAEKGITVTSF
jgi:hypothetical protein